ncbi:MAG: hypothetical protein KF822_09285 [Steroidobacteraceae bacterium]|nr:hypothetical protein [Steroidobacteraceae bacterium]
MHRSVLLPALATAALLWTHGSASGDDRLRRYELPDSDALEMTLPEGWVDRVDEQPGNAEITIELRPEQGAGFEVYVTPQSSGQAPGRIEDAETLRNAVRDAAQRLQAGSAAAAPEIRRMQGTDGVGFYFLATDPAPPDEYRHLVQGALLAGGLVLKFEILTHDEEDPAIAQALAMFQGAIHRDRGLGRP